MSPGGEGNILPPMKCLQCRWIMRVTQSALCGFSDWIDNDRQGFFMQIPKNLITEVPNHTALSALFSHVATNIHV